MANEIVAGQQLAKTDAVETTPPNDQCDGVETIGIYVPSTGAWFLRNGNSSGNADIVFSFGPANATPITGDWNGS